MWLRHVETETTFRPKAPFFPYFSMVSLFLEYPVLKIAFSLDLFHQMKAEDTAHNFWWIWAFVSKYFIAVLISGQSEPVIRGD